MWHLDSDCPWVMMTLPRDPFADAGPWSLQELGPAAALPVGLQETEPGPRPSRPGLCRARGVTYAVSKGLLLLRLSFPYF